MPVRRPSRALRRALRCVLRLRLLALRSLEWPVRHRLRRFPLALRSRLAPQFPLACPFRPVHPFPLAPRFPLARPFRLALRSPWVLR